MQVAILNIFYNNIIIKVSSSLLLTCARGDWWDVWDSRILGCH